MRTLILAILIIASPVIGASTPDIQVPASSGELVAPARLDRLANCLRRSGAVFYGASWCPHCAEQRRSFGVAATRLPYVECSVDGTKDRTRACEAANIRGFPTWIFADGTQRIGFVQPGELAELSGCAAD